VPGRHAAHTGPEIILVVGPRGDDLFTLSNLDPSHRHGISFRLREEVARAPEAWRRGWSAYIADSTRRQPAGSTGRSEEPADGSHRERELCQGSGVASAELRDGLVRPRAGRRSGTGDAARCGSSVG